MQRRAFLASGCAAFLGWPRMARATGGIDVGGPVNERPVRVLLASGNDIAVPRAIDAWHFAWNGRTYRGNFAYVSLPGGHRGLVNSVPLDAYLYGVVSAEVSPAWPSAAQEAQAIVARSYAMTKLRPARAYDVVASESDQRYNGIAGESVEGRAAVDATAGRVVLYADVPAQVAFGSCCGGRTADPAEVWHSENFPYLRSVADPHCAASPEFRWQSAVKLGGVQKRLELARAGTLRGVDLRDPDSSGRPRNVAFTGSARTVNVATRDFREAAGYGVVRSTFLRTVHVDGDQFQVEGNGRGHGVGMCQWGARGMASEGASGAAIVAFYFPGTTIGRLD